MNARETLEKYGLQTDVKSIRERIEDPISTGISLNEYRIKRNIEFHELSLMRDQVKKADIDLLCELALKGEQALTELEQIKARAEDIKQMVAEAIKKCDDDGVDGTMDLQEFIVGVDKIINGESKC